MSVAIPNFPGKAMAQTVVRASELKERRLGPFRKAVEVFNGKRQWSSGETVELMNSNLRGRPAMIYLRNEGGRVSLFLYRQGSRQDRNLISKPFPIGLLRNGWESHIDANEENYLRWHQATTDQINKQL